MFHLAAERRETLEAPMWTTVLPIHSFYVCICRVRRPLFLLFLGIPGTCIRHFDEVMESFGLWAPLSQLFDRRWVPVAQVVWLKADNIGEVFLKFHEDRPNYAAFSL